MLHAQERVAEIAARHAALVSEPNQLDDEIGGVGRVKDDARKQGAAVGCRHDVRLEEWAILRPERDDLACDVVAREHHEGRPGNDVARDAVRPDEAHSKRGAVRPREDTRQRPLARVFEAIGELAREPAGAERFIPGGSQAVLGLGLRSARRRRTEQECVAQRESLLRKGRGGGSRQKLVVDSRERRGHNRSPYQIAAPESRGTGPRRGRRGTLQRRMGKNRVFFPQTALDRWVGEGRVEVTGDELIIKAGARRYRILEAARVLSECTGVPDTNELVGKVKSRLHLSELGAELLEKSMVLGENAYDIVPGFLGAPIGTFEEHVAGTAGGDPSPAGAAGSAASEEDLLAKFLLEGL